MKTLCSLALTLVLAIIPCASRAEAWPTVGVSAHYAHWHGTYESNGAGGRFRWEPLPWLGVEGLVEALVTERDDGQRIDLPIGSQIYVPWEIVPRVRVRGLVGLCALVSLGQRARSGTGGGGSSDDIQLGVKVGGGFELALTGGWSLFSDLAWQRYLGHERAGPGDGAWSEGLGGALEPTDRISFALGLGVGL